VTGADSTTREKKAIMQIKKTEFAHLVVLLFLLVVVFAFNWIAGGTITSPRHLAIDLASPPDSPQDWSVQYWIPTEYRALFRWIVQGTYSVLFSPTDAFGFYSAFVFWSFFFFGCALIAFYFYLRVLDLSSTAAFIGGLLFLASPPVLLAYKYPVYTREDPLAYFLVLLGLIAVFKSKAMWVSVISAVAALTRETTLILPLAYVLASRDPWSKKFLVCLPPLLAVVGVRFLLGFAAYDPFEGSIYNLQTPGQTLAFLFCAFGVLWLPYLIRMQDKWREGNFASYAWQVLVATGPIILILVLGTQIVLARAREIRISFLLFPWVIPLALDWFRANGERLRALVFQIGFWVTAITILAILSLTILYFHLTDPELMRYYLADFKNGYWLAVGDIHLSATLAIFLPLLFHARNTRNHLGHSGF